VVKGFDTELAQDSWIARQIQVNLDSDELESDDILIVLPDTFRASRALRGLWKLCSVWEYSLI